MKTQVAIIGAAVDLMKEIGVTATLSAFAGAAVITAGAAMAYLALLCSAMVSALIALLVVRRHISRREVLLRSDSVAAVTN